MIAHEYLVLYVFLSMSFLFWKVYHQRFYDF